MTMTTTMMMTTDMSTRSLLGRAREASMLAGDVQAHSVAHAAADASLPAVDASAVVTTLRTDAAAVAPNPWLGGFGFGDGTGICPTTVVGDSTKRIHPGRLEGVT